MVKMLMGNDAMSLPEAKLLEELIATADDPVPTRIMVSRKQDTERRRARIVVENDSLIATANDRVLQKKQRRPPPGPAPRRPVRTSIDHPRRV